MNRILALLSLLASYFVAFPASATVTFDWATVGNPGNAADVTGYGAVDYTYRISKHEVTNAQYTEFLNAVAATDNDGLYSSGMRISSMGGIVRSGSPGGYTYAVKPPAQGQGPGGTDYVYDNKPVVLVSFFDAMRFANWLHNGQGAGGTETGVYDISNGLSETRSAKAKYWIPSENEWYKAAYHDATAGTTGVYLGYPTGADSAPSNNLPTVDTGNSANFYGVGLTYTTGSVDYPMTDVGAYGLSESTYGTFDQGGNAMEWNEAVIDSSFRGWRGGSWAYNLSDLHSDTRYDNHPEYESGTTGFRVATVPEPSTMLLISAGVLGLFLRRRQTRFSR